MQRPDSDKRISSSNLTKVGAISSAHGIRGQLKLRSLMADPEAIFDHASLVAMPGNKTLKIKREGYKDQLFIVSIDGVSDRNAAELLRGTELYAPLQKPDIAADNEWFYSDLTGLEARLESGKFYGKVSGVHNFGAGDIIEISFDDGKSEMLPFKPAFFGDVKLAEGYLIVYPPEYVQAGSEIDASDE